MSQSNRDHRAYNVYDEDIRAVENAVEAARNLEGAETVSEAIAEIAEAYTGHDGELN